MPCLPALLRHGLGAFTLAFTLAAVSPTASAGMENPRDTAAVQAVALDVELLHHIIAISQEARAALDGQDSVFYLRDEHNRPRTVDAIVAELSARPGVMAVLKRHRLDVRQYVLATLALMNGYLAAMRIRSTGESSWSQLDQWGVSKEHARFCMDHLDEIQRTL